MPDAISNTSPLLYLHRIDGLYLLPGLFTVIYVPGAVVFELMEGRQKGYDVPNPSDYDWISIVEPQAMPSEWFAVDLGKGEIAAMSLALERPDHIVLLDDALRHCVTPPPAEDKKNRGKVKGTRCKAEGKEGTRGKGQSFSLTDDLFMDYKLV